MPNQEGFATDLKEAEEVILRLSPKRLCRGALLNLGDLMVDVAGGAAGDVFRAILALILLGAGLGGFIPVILGALAGSAVGGAFKQVLKWLAGKVSEPGSEVVKCFMEFMSATKEASRYIDYEEVQDLVNDVAREWGIGTNAFKNLVRGFASLTEGSDVRKLFENGLRKVEELEAKVNELNNWINILKQKPTANIIIAGKADFEQGIIYPNIKVENGELRVRVGDGYHSIVRAGKFNELISDVESKLMGNGAVVVVGPKGIGKSTLAAAAVWELLVNGDIGLVARVDVLDSKNYSEFATFVENYGERFGEYFGRLLILYDPVSTEAYEKVGVDVEAPIQTSIERTIKNLMDVVNSISPEATKPLTLIVIPSDIYNALSNDMRAKLESHSLDVSQGLINTEFLAELVREYTRTKGNPNGCELSNDVLSKLAGELAKFDSGHALIARLIGEELARNNCDVGKIEELISNAKGKAKAFIILHINGLFKADEKPNTAKALVEIFTLRKPFVNDVRPGDPILTPGVVKLMGVSELSSWLAIRQHDLIEEAIKKLLDCIVGKGEGCRELGDVLEPWSLGTVRRSLGEVSEVKDVGSAVKYFVDNYGKEFITTLGSFSNCWKRATYIIGHALAGRILVTGPEDLSVFLPENLRKSVVGSLGDALNRCEIDDYLLVGNVIPPLIWYLTKNHTHALTEAFVDKYDEAVAEVSRVRDTARGRGISGAEAFYGLGLASIIAYAAGSGKVVESGGTDAALHIASFAIKGVVLPILIVPILSALRSLRDYAPHRYLSLLFSALSIENLDHDTVRYILDELNGILDNYGDVVKKHAWSLVHAIIAYAILLMMYLAYFYGEIENIVGRVVGLLNELDKLSPSLGIIAWAHALAPALEHEDVRRLMMKTLRINKVDEVIDKASEILKKLGGLEGRVQELMSDEEFRSYVESMYIKTDEEAVKGVILGVILFLKHALAIYKLNNDEFDEAERLFNEVAEESREIGVYENYLVNRGLALRVEAIKGSLVGDELVKKFRQLYEEAFSKEHFISTAHYLSVASHVLGDYLVSLALTGDHETISKLLEERWHWRVLNANKQASVLTRLTLNALLGPRGKLSSELKGRLIVEPRELIDAFRSDIHSQFLPALIVALGITKPEDGIKQLRELREWLINAFHNWLKGFGFDAEPLINEFKGLVNGLDDKSLVRLIAPASSRASLAFMLYALINGDEKLARAHALIGIVEATGNKLLRRLFLEAYRACCDLSNDEFRRAIASLFFLHV